MRKRRVGKFLWKHKKKALLLGGLGVSHSAAFLGGAREGFKVHSGIANYTPADRRILRNIRKEQRETAKAYANIFADAKPYTRRKK